MFNNMISNFAFLSLRCDDDAQKMSYISLGNNTYNEQTLKDPFNMPLKLYAFNFLCAFFCLSDERTYVEKRNGMSKMGFGGMVDSMALLTAISAIDLNGFFEVTSDIPQLIAQLNCFSLDISFCCASTQIQVTQPSKVLHLPGDNHVGKLSLGFRVLYCHKQQTCLQCSRLKI